LLEDPNYPVDPEVQDRIQAVADFLVKNNAKVNYRAKPAIDSQAAFRIFNGLLLAGLASRMQDEGFRKRMGHLRGGGADAGGAGRA